MPSWVWPEAPSSLPGRESETAGDVHRVLLGYVPALSLTSVVAGSIVLALAGELLVPGFPQGWLWLVFIAVPLSLYANFWNNLMVGVRGLVPMNLVQLAGGALTLLLNVVLVMALRGGVGAALLAYVLVLVVQAVAMLLLARGLASDGSPAAEEPGAADAGLRSAGLSWLGVRPALAASRRVYAERVSRAGSVGIFSVAQQLTEKLWLPTLAMQDVTYHGLSQGPRSTATQLMNRYLRFAFWGLIPVTLVGGMLVSWALPLLLGQAYDSAPGVSESCCWAAPRWCSRYC